MRQRLAALFACALVLGLAGLARALPPEVKAKAEARAKQLQALGTDTAVVEAVRAYNRSPPAELADMTNEKWKTVTLVSPEVKAFTRNPLSTYLKGKVDPAVTELFVSAASGNKVGFFSKPTSFCHKGKPKHDVPMAGKVWVGELEVDESTGAQQVQVSVPVLDGGKPIGSIVVGLAAAKL